MKWRWTIPKKTRRKYIDANGDKLLLGAGGETICENKSAWAGWQSVRACLVKDVIEDTVVAMAVLFVAYCIAGAGDLAEETRHAEETWAKPVVSETGVVEAWND